MTLVHEEALVILIAFGLYVYDSALLLYFNEGIMAPRDHAGWSVWIGSDAARLLGKHVFVPNPLMPHRPLYRLSWQVQGAFTSATCAWDTHRASSGLLASLIWGIAFALFGLLPIGLLVGLGDLFLLGSILFLYANIIAALLWLWLHRSAFELSNRRFAGLAFESLICSPCSLNLIRKTSQAIAVQEDLFSACRRLQLPGEWVTTRTKLLARLDEEIETAEVGSDRMVALQERRQTLLESSAP